MHFELESVLRLRSYPISVATLGTIDDHPKEPEAALPPKVFRGIERGHKVEYD